MAYQAFISYSHSADLELAPRVRDGLQKLAKKWNRRRALSIFLDQSSLELSSELGGALDKRIDDTEWLVLFMSEASAQSKWVGAEIAQWAEAKSKDRIALVLTAGEVVWDDQAKDFDYEQSTAINDGMRGVYTGQGSEPLYYDMRWTKALPDGEKNLKLDNVRFRDAIATIAAPIHGKSKDELEGDDIRQHRRLVRIRRIAVASLTILTIAAVTAGILALIKRAEAIREASRAESRALASDALNNAETETDLAALLALEGVRVANTTDARGSLAEVLSEPTRFLQRTDVHEGPITAIAFSENGRIAATGDQFGAVKVWDVNEEPLAVPQATPRDPGFELGYEIVDLFVVDDEDLQGVIGFDDEGFVYFIDLTTDDVSTVEPPDVFVSAAFNPEASLVAGLTDDGMLHVYSIDDNFDYVEQGDGLDLNSIGDLSPGEVPILTFSPDGGAVAIHLGTTFLVWPWADNGDWWGEELATPINSIAFSPDLEPERSIVAVGEDAGIIHLFDRQNPALRTLADPPAVNQLFDLAFKPVADDDGNFALASAHSNGDVVLWTVIPDPEFEPFGFEVDRLLGHNDETKKVAFAPDGRIASGDFSGEIIWWLDVPISSLGLGLFPDSEISEVRDAAFIDSTLVASIDADGTVWIWDEESFEGEAVNGGDVWSLDAAAGSIAVGLADGSVAILDPDGAETGRLGPAEPAPVAHVSLRTDGGGLVTVSEQGDTAVWDVAAGSILSEPELPEGFRPDSALHGDEGVVWIGGQDATDLPVVIKFDAGSGAQLGWLQHSDRGGNGVTALALSEDGNILATGSMDRRVQLWDSETLDATKDTEFTGHKGNVTGIVFWDDGNTLISSDDAGEVLVWDVSERRLFGVLGGPTDDVMSLEVDDASATLLASSEDGAVWTWTLDPAQWRARACELAGRNMTQAEWDRYGDGKKRVRHCEQWPPDGNDVRDANYSDNLTD